MDELPVEVIRKSARDIVVKHRQVLREQESDIHRNMDTLSNSLDNQNHAIINKLKTKRSISASELCIVKNNLMDASNNIDLVLNTHGALRGLVRELSGHDAAKQTIAAGCLCNLALGDTQASLVIAKAAGPYLIAALDNLATELAVTCAWTVGNLAGSGHTVCELLITQGSLNKLIGLLHSSNEEMKSAAEYAVTHFVYQMKDNLSTNHLSEILRESLKSDLTNSSAQIIFFLSCHEAFTESVPIDSFLPKLFQELTISLKYHSESCEKADFCCKLVYVIRILSNLKRDVENYNCIMNYFTRNNLELDFIRILSTDSECLVDSLLWLLGNLYKFQNNEMFFSKLLQLP